MKHISLTILLILTTCFAGFAGTSNKPDTCFTTDEITRIFQKFQHCEHLHELSIIDSELIENQQRQIKTLMEQKKACMVLAEAWHNETELYRQKYRQANRGRTFYKITTVVTLVGFSVLSAFSF